MFKLKNRDKPTEAAQIVDHRMAEKRSWDSKKFLLIASPLLLVIVGSAGFLWLKKSDSKDQPQQRDQNHSVVTEESAAVKAGKDLSGGQCEGEGIKEKLSVSAMKDSDFRSLIPYGLVVGDHVTPIDHQYWAPMDYKSKVNAYEVRAMADGHITSIGRRDNSTLGSTEYRMVFTQTCTFQYYYDLVTALAPDLKAAFDKSSQGDYYTRNPFNFEVKAGQVIGYIGGRTLDFAVWDTTKPLKGFIVPEHYKAESWKLYTADPLDYYTAELKATMLTKYIRTAEPISGKIDYDVDGRLIGNWFLAGTDYGGPIGATTHGPGGEKGHLSISPEHLDPTVFIVSIGDYQGQPRQYAVKGNAPWPGDVSTQSGLIKYELVELNYVKPDGSFWNRIDFVRGPRAQPGTRVQGVVLAQMLEDRKIKFEAFPNKKANQVGGFTPAAKIYER